MARDYTKLQVFHQAHRLALDVYALTTTLPPAERYGIQSQLRRAAISVPCNVVEGCLRRSVREYERFLEVAIGSAGEVSYLLRLVEDLHLASGEPWKRCRNDSDHVVRSLQKLHTAVGRLPKG